MSKPQSVETDVAVLQTNVEGLKTSLDEHKACMERRLTGIRQANRRDAKGHKTQMDRMEKKMDGFIEKHNKLKVITLTAIGSISALLGKIHLPWF